MIDRLNRHIPFSLHSCHVLEIIIQPVIQLIQGMLALHSYGLNYDVLLKSFNMDNISLSKIHAIPNIIFKDHISVHSYPEVLNPYERKSL